MIPPLVDGHLPVGRFVCDLAEIEQTFVNEVSFLESESRPRLFDGLLRYLRDWELAQDRVGMKVLKRLWVGGGFTSAKLETEDIDVSPILDARTLQELRGQTGSGRIKALYEHRDRIHGEYGVEPFVVLWSPFTTLKLKNMSVSDHEYVAVRGMMDDFWQRTSDASLKSAMLEEDAEPARGYLEVAL